MVKELLAKEEKPHFRKVFNRVYSKLRKKNKTLTFGSLKMKLYEEMKARIPATISDPR